MGTYVVLLTNAVHPSAESKRANLILEVRPRVADTAMAALDSGCLTGRDWWVPEDEGTSGAPRGGDVRAGGPPPPGESPPASASEGGTAEPDSTPGAGLRGGGAGAPGALRLTVARAAAAAAAGPRRLLARGLGGLPLLWRKVLGREEKGVPRLTVRLRPPVPPRG